MTDFNIEFLDTLADEVQKSIDQGHKSDEAALGVICEYKKFYLTIKNKSNQVLGVLTAYTAYAEVYVDDIWVEPNYRKQGLGRKLLADLENRCKGKGYNNINLVTSQFQAVDFYKKCGFTVEFVRQNKFNPKLTKFFFIKYFDDKVQHQGILEKRGQV